MSRVNAREHEGESGYFSFRFTRRYRIASRAFGVTPDKVWLRLTNQGLSVRFGPWRLKTPRSNIRSWAITGPYSFVKTAGPARLAITDRGLTFATNGDRGVAICFHEPVKGMERSGLLRHPELTVTVSDVDGLVDQLESTELTPVRKEQASAHTS